LGCSPSLQFLQTFTPLIFIFQIAFVKKKKIKTKEKGGEGVLIMAKLSP